MKYIIGLLLLPFCAHAQVQPYQQMLAPLGIPGVQSWNQPQQIIVVPQQPRNNLQQQIDLIYENQLIRNKELQNQLLQRELYKSFSADSLGDASNKTGFEVLDK